MPGSAVPREERIELRATREERRLLIAAAAHERLDLTSFVMRNALRAARTIMEQAEHIVLSQRDSELVQLLLETPPEPTPTLVEAVRRRRGSERPETVS